MATASMLSMTVANAGTVVAVPDNDVARLMYYLNCVTTGLGLNILDYDLVDYRNYQRLSHARTQLVFQSALHLKPEEFIDKLIFLDDEQSVTSDSLNKFCELSVACDIVSLQRDVLIAGQIQNVTRVMFFRSSWLEINYIRPLLRAVYGSQHCMHCKGVNGMCRCDECPRTANSQCQPLLSLLVESMSNARLTSSSTSPVPTIPTHACRCDGCSRAPEEFEGTRYRCKICDDYDLCMSCYEDNVHNLAHPFFQIDHPGSSPIELAPRSPPAPPRHPNSHQCMCDGCGSQNFHGTRYRCKVCDDYDLCRSCYVDNVHNLTHRFLEIDRPGFSPIELAPRSPALERRPPPPPPARRPSPLPRRPPAPLPSRDPPSYSSATATAASPFRYRNMTVSELKEYLKQYDVSCEDVLDKETLCRLAWETHCDCMTMPELNAFLMENNISTSDCRDIPSRRQKAKDVFNSSTTAPHFQEHDVVILTKLSRMELNGERATIVKADCGGGRAEVLLEESGQRIKVKFENLVVIQTTGR